VKSAIVFYTYQKMRHHRSLGGQVQNAVERGLGWVATAKGMYDVGRGIYEAGKVIAPVVASLL